LRGCVEAGETHRWRTAALQCAPETGATGEACLPGSKNGRSGIENETFMALPGLFTPHALPNNVGFEKASTALEKVGIRW
jgi:hypothetical protein